MEKSLRRRRHESEAREKARWVLDRYAIEDPEHLDLERIAGDLRVQVIDAPIDGAVARLVRHGDRGLIRLSSELTHPGRRRFSLAHELGHFLLEHAESGWLGCAEQHMTDLREAAESHFEAQANLFAAELLLPERLVKRRCEVSPVDFRPIVRLAEDFTTSITSAAIRFVEFSPEVCALVFSRDGRIAWSKKSPEFRGMIRGWGEALDRYSVAFDYFEKGRIHDRPEQVDASAWLEGWMADRVSEVVEHSLAISSLNAVQTTVWVPVSQLENDR